MALPTLENVCCRLRVLENQLADGGGDLTSLTAIQNAIIALQAIPNNEIVYAAGTADTIATDDTQVALDFGTTDPSVVLGKAGTYLILAQLQLEYTGATITTQTASFKLRRTNNTAADITGSPVTIDLPQATTLTHTYGVINLPPVIVTTANADDAIAIFGALSAATGAGTIDVSAASIVAIRIS